VPLSQLNQSLLVANVIPTWNALTSKTRKYQPLELGNSLPGKILSAIKNKTVAMIVRAVGKSKFIWVEMAVQFKKQAIIVNTIDGVLIKLLSLVTLIKNGPGMLNL